MRTDEEKKEIWDGFCKKQTEEVGQVQKAGMDEVAQLLCLELMGGPCPVCKRQWKKVTFDGMVYSGEYWVPDCHCYHTCPRCGQELYIEQASGSLRSNGDVCPNCKWALTDLKRQSNIENKKGDFAKIFLEKYYISILRKPRYRRGRK